MTSTTTDNSVALVSTDQDRVQHHLDQLVIKVPDISTNLPLFIAQVTKLITEIESTANDMFIEDEEDGVNINAENQYTEEELQQIGARHKQEILNSLKNSLKHAQAAQKEQNILRKWQSRCCKCKCIIC